MPPSSTKSRSSTIDMPSEHSPLLRKLPPRPITPTSFSSCSTTPSLPPPKLWHKQLTLVTALLNCLFAGSVLVYSLWTPMFLAHLSYTQMQVNIIASAAEIGMYLPVPIFGYICDRYGPSRLSALSALFFGPGYALAATSYAQRWHWWTMVAAFAAVGMGTSSMYFSGVTTCAKTFTGRRGLALAAPIAAFGLSSLWMTQLVSRVFITVDGELEVAQAFWFFSATLMVVGLMGSWGLRWSGAGSEDDEEESAEEKGWLNEDTRAFLRDRTMWWFAAGVFLVTGPGEAFINNMGTLIHTLPTQPTTSIAPAVSPATHVSLIALTSTLSRLLAGSLSDYLAPSAPTLPPSRRRSRPTVSRLYILFTFALLMMGGFLLVSTSYIFAHPASFWLVSSSIGAGYGAVFCLAPTVVSVVWGTKNFGTNWGIVTITPALGAVLFGSLFAAEFDKGAEGGRCRGVECARWSFTVMAASVGVAVIGWMWAWRGKGGWKERGVAV